jgi:hypothetical protein
VGGEAVSDETKVAETSRVPIAERELIQRAINSVSGKHEFLCSEGDAAPRQRWVIVRDLFCCGSTVATAICHKYGYDPDKVIGGNE